MRRLYVAVMLILAGHLAAVELQAQETQQPSTPQPATPPQNEVRRAIRWKEFQYTCDDGTKIPVYLSGSLAKVLFQNHQYLMEQTPSADGNRYSNGKILWWGKGSGGFLQEDKADGDGKILAKNCRLEKPSQTDTGTITGTVAYIQRIALPPDAVIEVQLEELPIADAREHSNLIAKEKITLGNRQVPVPFELKFDPERINPNRAYGLTARILVGDKTRFYSGHGYLVLTQGNPSHLDIILDQAGSVATGKQ